MTRTLSHSGRGLVFLTLDVPVLLTLIEIGAMALSGEILEKETLAPAKKAD
jgi:hypothetical protein